MFKRPKTSPLTASIAGLVAGFLVATILASNHAFGVGVVRGLSSILAGGAALVLAVAYVGDCGRLMRAGGRGNAAQWYLRAFLFLMFAMAPLVFLTTQFDLLSIDG